MSGQLSRSRALLSLVAIVWLTACSRPEPETTIEVPDTGETVSSPVQPVDFSAASEQVQGTAIALGATMREHCNKLQQRVHAFLEAPDDSGRDAAREAYHACYEQWNRYRLFLQLPFTLAEREAFERTVHLTNTRPFQPGYIDGLPDYPFSGLVHESGLELSLDTLLDQHRMMDEESASLGFPVIETLLWREPLAQVWIPEAADSSGVVERRHRYLSIATDDLTIRLRTATERWQPGGSYSQLPRRTRLRVFWQSAQRLVQAELLDGALSEAALDEPEWHHPSTIAGQGKRHWLARLAGLEAVLAKPDDPPSALAHWYAEAGLQPTMEVLRAHLSEARSAVSRLPGDYPRGNVDPATWREARQALTQLAADLNDLSRQLELAILTE